MGFASVFSTVLSLSLSSVLGVQQLVGAAKSGADKKTLAMDALQEAFAVSTSLFAPGSQNAQFATLAATLASGLIDAAVKITKLTGSYQAATAAAAKALTVPPVDDTTPQIN